jgi:hypothetical protein
MSPASPAAPSSSVHYSQTKLPDWDWAKILPTNWKRFKIAAKAVARTRRRLRVDLLPSERSFRHEPWGKGRRAVARALRDGDFSRNRRERFLSCGCRSCVEYSRSQKRFRISAWFCYDRFCRPCGRTRARKLQQAIDAAFGGREARFITLTLRGKGQSCRAMLCQLLKSFARLRRTKVWTRAVTGGVRFIEAKRGDRSGCWHVHMHLLVAGVWIDQEELRNQWFKITSDSFVCDVRAVPDLKKGVWYVAKYSAKGCGNSLYGDPEYLLQWMRAVGGRRLVGSFGVCRCGRMECPDKSVSDFRTVGTLAEVTAAASKGETWAVAVLSNLRPKPGMENDAGDAIKKAFQKIRSKR